MFFKVSKKYQDMSVYNCPLNILNPRVCVKCSVIMSDMAKEKAIRLLKKRESMSSLGSQDVRARREELTVKTKE